MHQWEVRRKFLLIATLAYAFLLSLLSFPDSLPRLFQLACHRTGKWSRDISAPLYRLRLAVCRLWLAYPTQFSPFIKDSGNSCLRDRKDGEAWAAKEPSGTPPRNPLRGPSGRLEQG